MSGVGGLQPPSVGVEHVHVLYFNQMTEVGSNTIIINPFYK
jgi:hypothetical protein